MGTLVGSYFGVPALLRSRAPKRVQKACLEWKRLISTSSKHLWNELKQRWRPQILRMFIWMKIPRHAWNSFRKSSYNSGSCFKLPGGDFFFFFFWSNLLSCSKIHQRYLMPLQQSITTSSPSSLSWVDLL